jgi:hypothetical protein
MGKPKPDKTISYRIELQDKERELLSQLAFGYTFKNIATPIVDLMKDVSGMIVFASLLTYIGIKVNLSGITSNSSMANVVERIDDAFTLSRQSENLQSIPFDFVKSFWQQLANQDWRASLDPFPDNES